MTMINKQAGTYTSFDGTEIYYEVRGQGEPIVFCYGIGCLFNHWTYQIKYFSENYQTIMLDYRGHNKSAIPTSNKNITIDAVSEDIRLLLEKLELKNAHFVAHSFGAQILINTYSKYPQIFKSMTFINGFVSNPIQGMFGSDLPKKAYNAIKKTYDLLPETATSLWRLGVNNPITGVFSALAGGFNLNLTSFKDIEIYSNGIANIDLRVFLRFFHEMMNYDGRPVLKTIDVPCLIISGRRDNITPVEHQHQLHEEIKNSEFSSMAYGTHCTQLDLPEYVNIRIEKFIQSIN